MVHRLKARSTGLAVGEFPAEVEDHPARRLPARFQPVPGVTVADDRPEVLPGPVYVGPSLEPRDSPSPAWVEPSRPDLDHAAQQARGDDQAEQREDPRADLGLALDPPGEPPTRELDEGQEAEACDQAKN